MKVNGHQQCQRCGGSKIIVSKFSDQETSEISEPCPRCNGEGIEYLVSPKYVEEYDGLLEIENQYNRLVNVISIKDQLENFKETPEGHTREDIEGTPV